MKPIASVQTVDARYLSLNKPGVKYVSVQVNYGDGSPVSESFRHTYNKSGSYLVSVNVTSILGISCTGWVWVNIV